MAGFAAEGNVVRVTRGATHQIVQASNLKIKPARV